MRGREADEASNLVLVGEILADAFLEHGAEGFPELGVLLLVVLGQVFEHAQHLARAAAADAVDVLALLQDFARHIERQVA